MPLVVEVAQVVLKKVEIVLKNVAPPVAQVQVVVVELDEELVVAQVQGRSL